MSRYTYKWGDAAQTHVLRNDGTRVPVDPGNVDYQEAIVEGISPYVEPVVPPRTKVERLIELLAAHGLTVDDLKAALR